MQTAPTLPTAAAPVSRPRPESLRDLFLSFTWLALQGFGGVLAVVQREIVEKKRWLTPDEFLEDWAVAQVLPGPNVINLALMIGDRHFGLRGAVTAVAGMLTLPLPPGHQIAKANSSNATATRRVTDSSTASS